MLFMNRFARPFAGVMTKVEAARSIGQSVASKVRDSSHEVAARAEELAATSRSRLSERLGSAQGWGKMRKSALRVSAMAAVDVAGRAYTMGKHAARDPQVQRVAATLATLAITAAIKRNPAGTLASSVLEAIARSEAFKRGRGASPGWQSVLAGSLAGSVRRHTWKRIGQTGGLASFTYVDANGVVTERMVRNWRSTGRLIRGRCLLRNEIRSFRIDRIEGWSELE